MKSLKFFISCLLINHFSLLFGALTGNLKKASDKDSMSLALPEQSAKMVSIQFSPKDSCKKLQDEVACPFDLKCSSNTQTFLIHSLKLLRSSILDIRLLVSEADSEAEPLSALAIVVYSSSEKPGPLDSCSLPQLYERVYKHFLENDFKSVEAVYEFLYSNHPGVPHIDVLLPFHDSDSGTDSDDSDDTDFGPSPLIQHALRCLEDPKKIFEIALRFGANANVPSRSGWTALEVALLYFEESPDFLKHLLQIDCDIIKPVQGFSSLIHFAAASGHGNILHWISQIGHRQKVFRAILHQVDHLSNPFFLAVSRQHFSTADFLLKYLPDTVKALSAVAFAEMLDDLRTTPALYLLKKKLVPLNQKNSRNQDLMVIALHLTDVRLVTRLLNLGYKFSSDFDPEAVLCENNTSRDHDYEEILRLIRQN